MILLVVACMHAAPVDPALTPRLPAPFAGTYARVDGVPPDPVVASWMDERRWESSLGGAAAGLALWAAENGCTLERWRAQEAAWAAGYPYPLTEARCWDVLVGGAPPGELAAWLGALPPEADVGLVRARGTMRDAWVAVSAVPWIDLGVVPRVVSVDTGIPLPPVEGGVASVSGPGGARPVRIDLASGAVVRVDAPGEWLVSVDVAGQVAARFPIYAGMAPPEEPLFAGGGDLVQVLDELVAAYDLAPWAPDELLDGAARSLLRPGADRAAVAAGLAADGRRAVWCADTTFEDCVAGLAWTAEGRQVLLDPSPSMVGLAERVGPTGIEVAIVRGAD